jgi:ribosomal protein L37E
MAYRCHKCEAQIFSLRLGYCSNCQEPISTEILPESKKQALATAEREYIEMREQLRAQKEQEQKEQARQDRLNQVI